MSNEEKIYPVPGALAERAWIDRARYEAMYQASVEDPERFWREQAGRLEWMEPFTTVKDVSYRREDLRIRWFADGKLNASVNCLDRHHAAGCARTALIVRGVEPSSPLGTLVPKSRLCPRPNCEWVVPSFSRSGHGRGLG
jgi:acetyl-CoA synthetase